MTTLIEAAVETVKDRSGDLVDVVGALRSSAAELIAPEPEKSSRSWLWVLLLAIVVVVVLAILRQRSAANEASGAEGP